MNGEHFNKFPELHSQRLIIRKLIMDDVQTIFNFNSDPDSLTHIARDPFAEFEQGVNLTTYFVEGYEKQEMIWWAITLITGKMIGYIGLFNINPVSNKAEIGYGILRQHWGKGYASEVVKIVTDFGFNGMDLHRIWGNIAPENIASIRILEKLGLEIEGTLRDVDFARGKYFSFSIYSRINRN